MNRKNRTFTLAHFALTMLIAFAATAFSSCATISQTSRTEDLSTLFVEQYNESTKTTEIIIPEMNNYPVRLYITKGVLLPYKLNLEVTYEGPVWIYTKKITFSSNKVINDNVRFGKLTTEIQKNGDIKEVYTASLSDTDCSSLYYFLLNKNVFYSCQGKHYSQKKQRLENQQLMIDTIKYYTMLSPFEFE